MTWHISRDGVTQGPYSDDQLGRLVETGDLKPHDFVWRPGLVRWTLASEVPGLLNPPSTSAAGQDHAALLNAEPLEEKRLQPAASDQIERPLPAESPCLPDQVSPETRRASYFARHWRGELSLPVSYWVNGFFLTVLILAIIQGIHWDELVATSRLLFSTSAIIVWIVLAAASIWQLVGIWRSADNYLGRGKSKLWENWAKIGVVLGLIRFSTDFISMGIPQIAEYAKIATGNDPVGTYQLRVLRDATELEISGAIPFGLTDDVRRTLDAQPTIRIIHLNSQGGRVGEARRLRDLIDSRGLTTFTASGCLSACTVAYVGGRQRLIAKDARLGFHQYSFPGLTGHEFQAEYERDKRDWLARGFARQFVERAFATPNNEMWKPTSRELFEAGVVTGYPGSNDVAITGFKLGDLETLESDLLRNPLYAALKTYEPKMYDQVVSEMRLGMQQGRSQAELRSKVFPLMQSVYMRKLPYASDAALRSFTSLFIEQMKALTSIDPTLCYQYAYGQEQGRAPDITGHFSEELQQREFRVMAEVIGSAAGQMNRPPAGKWAERELATVFAALAKRFGESVQMLAEPERGKRDLQRLGELPHFCS